VVAYYLTKVQMVIVMKPYDKVTPIGTQDKLFEQCYFKNEIAVSLRNLFENCGFSQAATPLLEYYDVFESSRVHFPQENTYKLIETTGRIMVLRPDCTIPIARLAATRFKDYEGVLRIYYHQPVYRIPVAGSAASGEIDQMGVEIIGEGDFFKDLEVLELAAKSLDSSGKTDFQFELCHIGYFNALVESLNADAGVREEIREAVERKNFPALDRLMERFEESSARSALKKLPSLFGGVEILKQAGELFSSKMADSALYSLMQIYDGLSSIGIEKRFMIDLGLVHQADYYTGIIFRGYAEGAGEPVLSGGRYDRLHGEFGNSNPATGFAINLDVLSKGLQGSSPKKKHRVLVVFSEGSSVTAIYKVIDQLRKEEQPYELHLSRGDDFVIDKSGFERIIRL
jgi:ATP phosphoribosyltransferase regulatory subunit